MWPCHWAAHRVGGAALLLWASAPPPCFSCLFGLKSFGAGTPALHVCAGRGAWQTPPVQSHLLLSSGCCCSSPRQDGHRHRSRPTKIVSKNYDGPTRLNARNLQLHYIFNLLLVLWSGANFALMKIKESTEVQRLCKWRLIHTLKKVI